MDQTPVTTLIAALCLMCMSGVLADDCAPYVGSDFTLHRPQTCVLSFCSGSCTNRYCNIIPGTALDQSQFLCILTNLYFVIGFGIVTSILFVVGVIACCCKSLFLCCRACSSPTGTTSNVAVTNYIPQQPLVQIPYSTASTGYQPVPNQSMYAGQHNKAYLPPPYPGAENLAFVEEP